MRRNAIVGQSGGPTAAINATLAGVIKGCLENDAIDKVYGMRHGVDGILNDNVTELNDIFESSDNLDLLIQTPAAALGSCRKKLPVLGKDDAVYESLFAFFDKYDIGYFFYIGGNDSMDTVHKLTAYAKANNIEGIRFVGVPKTIDNDLAGTDHTPGYGSAAKYIATTVAECVRDCAVYTVPAVTIIEIMGRDAGWLTASAALAEAVCGYGVDYIYLPETVFTDEQFFADIEKAFKRHPNVVIAVSEGIRYADGEYVGASGQSGAVDAFGHKYLSGTGKTLEHKVKDHFGCKVRSVEVNILQRCAGHLLSKTDIDESVSTGEFAVNSAAEGYSGVMVCSERKDGKYALEFVCKDIAEIANKIKCVPAEYINNENNGITHEGVDYMLPLIQGEVDLVWDKGLPKHFVLE
ncbi:MAG: 6-phosphofructokinase [Clostridia bacterium]|nr:6-phosphofructokinase [Clostridia bacterium]